MAKAAYIKTLIVKLYNAGLNGTEIFKCVKKGLDIPVSKATVYRVINEVKEQDDK